MYMDKKYTLAEFRKNTREAFNAADDMVDVIVERFGKPYILITKNYYTELLKTDAKSASPPSKPKVTPSQVLKKIHSLKTAADIPDICTGHDHFKRNCGRKGCEYA